MRSPSIFVLFTAMELVRISIANPLPSPHNHSRIATTSTSVGSSKASAAAISTPTPVNGHIIVTPGDANAIIMRPENTLNATAPSASILSLDASTSSLSLALVNNYAGKVNAYVTGLDINGRLIMLQPDGTFYSPTCTSSQTSPLLVTANVAIPLGAKGSTTNINIPGYISAARVWFAADDVLKFYIIWNPATNAPSLIQPSSVNPSDPSAAINWGFVELTYLKDAGLYANLSYVDFVGLVLGIQLTVTDGSGTQTALGLPANALSSICNALDTQSQSDGQAWSRLCLSNSNGKLLRAISPAQFVSANPTAFNGLWTSYIQNVWTQYETQTLKIDTQSSAGTIACTISKTDNTLHCPGSSNTYAQPTASDIFGCNTGPFAITSTSNPIHKAIVPRLCAAINRSTLLLQGGNSQPSLPATSSYGDAVTNWYSKVVHVNEVDGRGYAFSYDDVAPTGGKDQSGTVASKNPGVLKVVVGGPL